jgi:hypothetical protein
MNRYLFHTFYRGHDGEWHQPGTMGELPDDEGASLIQRGHAKMIETMSLEQPETRVVKIRRGRSVKGKI